MYYGKNPIAIQSCQWIIESLICLMKEKAFSQITVLDICKKAQLSRQTFYNCFESKEEILHFHLQQEYEKQFEKYSKNNSISVSEIIEAFACVIRDNQSLLDSMLVNHLDVIIADEISKCVRLFANQFVRDGRDNELLPYSEALLSGALAQLLTYWLKQEKVVSLEDLTKLLEDFFCGKLFELDK